MNIKATQTIVLLSFVGTLLFSAQSFAEKKILFEGYYKISLFSEHVGFFVQRYELDTAKKHFLSTYFLRTNPKGGNIAESLTASSTSTLEPLKFKYTGILGKKIKTIDGNVLKNVLYLRTTEGGKAKSSSPLKMDKGTFFSTFLAYLLLQGKKGLAPGVKYSFKAIAEEKGKIQSGEAFVEKEETFKGVPTYKILNTFNGVRFVNFVTSKGDSLRSTSPASGLNAELVANPIEATKGMPSSESNLKSLFGSVPKGQVHPLVKVKK